MSIRITHIDDEDSLCPAECPGFGVRFMGRNVECYGITLQVWRVMVEIVFKELP